MSRWRDALAGYGFIAPAAVLYVVFIAGPLVGALVLSLYQWDLLTPAEFVGFANYRSLLGDDEARTAITNTFVFAFWSIVLHIGGGLLLALAVNRAISTPLKYFLRTAFFFPVIMSWAAASLIWNYALSPNFGFVNYYLQQVGFSPPRWLTSPAWAMPTVIFVDLWKTLGFTFIILLAGLQGIPAHLYEAAKIDGAGAARRFKDVTVPMLSPTLFFAAVISFIGAFQILNRCSS